MTSHKNQHYVSRFYLKHFSIDGVGLYRYNLDRKTAERRNIEKTCSSFHFYSDPSENETLEQMLPELEQLHSRLLERIIADRNLSSMKEKDLPILCNMVLLMNTRTWSSKKDAELMANAVYGQMKLVLNLKCPLRQKWN